MDESIFSNNTTIVTPCLAWRLHMTNLAPYLMIFVFLRMFISCCAIFANSKLLYLQYKTKVVWFESERPLIVGILSANILGATAVCVVGTDRFISFFSQTNFNKWYVTLMISVSDACMISSVLCIFVLTIQSYCVIKYFYQKQRYQLGKIGLTILTWCIMLFTVCISIFGLNAHSVAIFYKVSFMMNLIFSIICYTILLATGFILYKTRRMSSELQTDFVVNRAWQRLEKRVTLHRTIENIRALVPISAINVIICITLWGIDLIIDYVISTTEDAICGQPAEFYIWSSIIDITSAVYGLMYPSMLTRKQEPISIQLRKGLCCQYRLSHDIGAIRADGRIVAVSTTNGYGTQAKVSTAHWTALQNQWERVAKLRIDPNMAGTSRIE